MNTQPKQPQPKTLEQLDREFRAAERREISRRNSLNKQLIHHVYVDAPKSQEKQA